jgi:hypothetical protein
MLGTIGRRIAVCMAIGTLIALAPGVAQAGTWLSPVPINASSGSAPSVALDASGNAVAVWQTNPVSPTASVVQGAHHLVGASGFPALPDFSSDTTAMHANITPVVVTNRSGDGLAVWVNDQAMGYHQIQLRTIAPGGTVGPVVTVPSGAPLMTNISNPTAAIDAEGDAVVAWQQGAGINAITRQGLNGSFTNVASPDQLAPLSSSPPAVAIDGAGNAIAVWQTGPQIEAKRHPSGGAWSGTTDPSLTTAGHTYSDPAVAANPTGQMVVAFIDFDGTNQAISAVTGTVAGGWGASATVTALSPTGVTQGPGVSVDDAGGAAVGWAIGTTVQVSLRPAGGAFPAPGAAQSITPVPAAPNNLLLAGDGRGDTVIAWSTFETGAMQNVVRAAVRRAGASTFSATQVVSSPATYAGTLAIALDQHGDAVVAYQLGAVPAGIGTAVYDGAGPLLGTPTGPASVARGAAAAFSVAQPLDAFSSVASVKWSFGDGSSAVTGTHVSHKFGTAGKFTVTVTATDAVGNSSSTTLKVTVTGPPGAKCVVPKLKGKSLSRAKGLLKRAHCALGKVHKPKHHKHGKLVVTRSSPGAGAKKLAGTKVALTLGPPPKPHKHK